MYFACSTPLVVLLLWSHSWLCTLKSQQLSQQSCGKNGTKLTRSTETFGDLTTSSNTSPRRTNQQPSNLEGSGSERSKRGRKAQRRRARATRHGNKECQMLLDDDETSKTIGHTGLSTTRRRNKSPNLGGLSLWEKQRKGKLRPSSHHVL